MLLRISEAYHADDEAPFRFIFHSSGTLAQVDDDGTELEIGLFKTFFVDAVGAITEGESVFNIFDAERTSCDYYQALYDYDSDDFKPRVRNIACGGDFIWNPNLLVLDRLVIYPAYRGNSLGLLAMRALIHRFRAGAGLIAIKPFPLQFEASARDDRHLEQNRHLGFDAFDLSESKATTKLRKYYGQLGFKRVPRSEYMVRSADIRLPNVDSLSRQR